MDFWTKLASSIHSRNSLLCVGLDPVPARIPPRYPDVASFNRAIIDMTADLACAYKPNIAFYEALGLSGMQALADTLAYIPSDLPVILDAKRGDISSSAEAYARAMFDVWQVDAVTIVPYLGRDGVIPFLREGRGVFVLCKTSNPSADEIQGWTQAGQPLYHHVADLAMSWAAGGEIGLVIGATYPVAIAEIRQRAPRAWFLVPGVGAQGGKLEDAVAAGLRENGLGLLINASRSILYADDPRASARALKDAINQNRGRYISTPDSRTALVSELAEALFSIGAVRFGDFRLHSGKRSPVYIDLRLLASYPRILNQVARAYAQIVRELPCARLAAIPYAALPIGTAVSLLTGIPMIYARREAKAYGTGRQIEGAFETGDRVALLDDLITSGESKLEAIGPLENAGLIVRDVVVLIDREQGGKKDLAKRGYALHAVLTLRELVQTLEREGHISSIDAHRVYEYLEKSRGR